MAKTKKRRKIKPFEKLTIQDDYLFKRIMLEKDICIRFLESLLHIKIRDIKYIGIEKSLKETYLSKGIRLDVYVEDDNNTIYNIEMQISSDDKIFLGNRIRYYQALIDSVILKRGDNYKNLKNLYIIFICPFVLFSGERQVYFFKNYCRDDKSIELQDKVTKILISTKGKEEENLDQDLKSFIDYVDGIITDNDFVQTVNNRIEEIKQKEIERSFYMQYELRLRDEREAGKREGKIEGKQEKLVENIRLLIENANFSVGQVMQILKVPEEEQEFYLRLLNDPAFYEEYFSDDEEEYEEDEE
ncbi:Rpn family recombination-promoting nuclease/putative transposase [bacterium]|nr:Rpn family recombination-promoting nuclease/putative transposase [bacterium]